MLVYFSILIICCVICFVTQNNDSPKRTLCVLFGLIWCMIAFQEGWGGDYMSYVNSFDYLKGQSISDLLVDDSHGEVGYKIFLSLCPSYRISFWIGILIYCVGLAFFFYKFVPRRWWPLMLFFLFVDRPMMMGAISSYPRMAIANAALIFSYYFLSKGNRIGYIAIVFLAMFFHKSIFFLLPFFFVKGDPIKISLSKGMIVCVLIAFLSILMPSTWVSIVDNILSGVSELEDYALHYIDSTQNNDTKGISLIFQFYWVYLLLRLLRDGSLDTTEYIILKFALIRIVFDLLPAIGMSVRVFYYLDYAFFAGMMVVLSHMSNKDSNKWALIVSLLIMYFYFGFMTFSKDPFWIASWAKYHYIF